MESFDPVFLARLQFAFTIGFHIVLPAFTIGLASYMAVLNLLHFWSGRRVWLDLFDYWKRIFAISFGMGVVSGIVMSYQFGTNWSVFSDRAGPVIGPLMGYEVLTAFFLEAGFLGVMLFGRDRVGPAAHLLATVMVAFGTLLSAFWILAVNSWMQTPAGHAVNAAGQFVVVSWPEVIFNPSFVPRFIHMVLAAYLTTALAVGAVAAWHLLRDPQAGPARIMFAMAAGMVAVVAPLQVVAGDRLGLNTFKHQPAKIAAMEGHFETRRGAPFYIFGIPDAARERMDYALAIPKAGSLILTHDLEGEVKGLKEWPKADRPPVGMVFWSFRLMVGLGFAMVALGFWAAWSAARGVLFTSRPLLRSALLMGPAGFVALLAGWVVSEVGRQPYTVYGLMRTAESASPIDASAVGASLAAFAIVYPLIFGAGFFYILREMAKSPGETRPDLSEAGPVRAAGITPAYEALAKGGRADGR